MHIATTDEDIAACFDVLKELRPKLERESFVPTIRQMQAEGYVLASLRRQGEVACVAGFRVCINLAAEGKALYVYDLVTRETSRSQDLGEQMLDGIKAYARDAGCTVVHLDSHVTRFRAHKFYLRNDFSIVAHHFLFRPS